MPLQYLRAAESIQQQIRERKLPPGSSLPSTRALARTLGYSHAAVARASSVLIAGGILDRKGYRTTIAHAPTQGPPVQGVIEVVTYTNDFARASAEILTERQMKHHVTELSWRKHPDPRPILRKIAAARPAGVIFCLRRVDAGIRAILKSMALPIVLMCDGARDLEWSTGQMDYYRGTENALSHLYDLGHRYIANAVFPDEPDLEECHRAVCRHAHLRASAALIFRPEVRELEDVRETLLAALRRHPRVTALTCDVQMGVFIKKFIDVPAQLSLVCFGAESKPPDFPPALTAVESPPAESTALWACHELISQIQNVQSGRALPPATEVYFVPRLVVQDSTRALALRKPPAPAASKLPAAAPHPGDSWRKIYPFLKKSRWHNWRQLDLAPLANHSLTRNHGWLGAEPLEHFPPGLRAIHGVPFRVLDEERNDGRAVLTFRSIRSHSSEGKQLPIRARIKVNSRLEALYFLHGCGSARPTPFARYVMHYEHGGPVTVPLIPLGLSRRFAAKHLGGLKPNLQDWWPDFEQVEFPHAHRAIVFDPSKPAAYQRSIYSLEWINPRLADELKFIEVLVDPKAGPTLALIAVSALLP